MPPGKKVEHPAALAAALAEPMVEDKDATKDFDPTSRSFLDGIGDFSAPEPEPVLARGIELVPGVSVDAFSRDEFISFARTAAQEQTIKGGIQPQRSARDVDQLDPLTKALGASHWLTTPVYDWCRQRGTQVRLPFTRFYYRERILVDVFPAETARVKSEVVDKTACLTEYNRWVVASDRERSDASFDALRKMFIIRDISEMPGRDIRPIGYLPVIRGTTIPVDVIERVKLGYIAELQVHRRNSGVFA